MLPVMMPAPTNFQFELNRVGSSEFGIHPDLRSLGGQSNFEVVGHLLMQPTPAARRIDYQLTVTHTSGDEWRLDRVDSHPDRSFEPLLPAAKRISKISGLGENWDCEGALAPSALAYSQALELMLILAVRNWGSEASTVPTTSAPIADGGLQIEWEGRQARIEVQSAPDGTFGYLVVRGDLGAREYDEADDLDINEIVNVIQRTVFEG